MPTHAPRWRTGSVFCCAFRPLDRNDLARILFLAEALDRNTHRAGHHGGCLGRTGLAVLRALITRFFNKASGRLDPSIAAIAHAANVARSTAQEALSRLELAGILERVRRIARVRLAVQCQITGRPALITRVVQTTNAYLLSVPSRQDHGSPDRPPRRDCSDTGKRSETTYIFNSMPKKPEEPLTPSLAAALERLRNAMIAKEVTA